MDGNSTPPAERDMLFYISSGALIGFACLDAVAFNFAAKSVPSLFLSVLASVLGVPVYVFCYWCFEVRHDPSSMWALWPREGKSSARSSGRRTTEASNDAEGSDAAKVALFAQRPSATGSLGEALIFDEGADFSMEPFQPQAHDVRSSNQTFASVRTSNRTKSSGSSSGSSGGGGLCTGLRGFLAALAPPAALLRGNNFVLLVLFALLSSLSSAMVIIGASHTAGGMQALLYQLVIPFNLALSGLILKHRARPLEYLGALVVVGGIVVVYLPQILPGSNAVPISGTTVLFNVIYAAGIVPSSLNSILSERALKTWEGVTILGFSAWLQVVSLPLTLLTVPLYTLSVLGDYAVGWDELGGAYRDGFRCVFGGADHVEVEFSCKWGLPSSCLAVCSNAGISVVALFIIQRYSASSMVIVAALSLPVTELVFNIPGLSEKPNWTWELFVGLALIVGGNAIHRSSRQSRPHGEADKHHQALPEEAFYNNEDGGGGDEIINDGGP